jgi:hypothetical protein
MSDSIHSNSQPLPSAGFKGSDLPPLVTDKPPHVLIAGAGLAGLFLGILLEEAGIPYAIFERSAEIKPLGNQLLYAIPVLCNADVEVWPFCALYLTGWVFFFSTMNPRCCHVLGTRRLYF